MGVVDGLIKTHTLEAKAAHRSAPKAAKPKRVAKVGKSHAARGPGRKAPPAAKSEGGLQIKLSALAKKYPGIKFEIITLKTKQNQVKVSGIGKMPHNELVKLYKQIPNTSHIPQRVADGVAYFTLFGKKEITGSDRHTAGNDFHYVVIAQKDSKTVYAEFKNNKVVFHNSAKDQSVNKFSTYDNAKKRMKEYGLLGGIQKITANETVKPLSTITTMLKADAAENVKSISVSSPRTAVGDLLAADAKGKKKVFGAGKIVTASVYLNPEVGAAGVVYRDDASTDDEFVSSGHENQGDRYPAVVKEVKGQRLRIDIAGKDGKPIYHDAWIFATDFYKNTTDAVTAAVTDTNLIDGIVSERVASGSRKTGYMSVADVRKACPNFTKDEVDASLIRMHNDMVVSLTTGSGADTDIIYNGKDKFNRVYPGDQLKQIYASDDDDLKEARRAFKQARRAHDEKPGPETQAAHKQARRNFVKAIKKVLAKPAMPYSGPPKPKRVADKTKTVTAVAPAQHAALQNAAHEIAHRKAQQTAATHKAGPSAEDPQEKALAKEYAPSMFKFHLTDRSGLLSVDRTMQGYTREHALSKLKAQGRIPKGFKVASASGKAVKRPKDK